MCRSGHARTETTLPMPSIACACADPAVNAACASETTAVCCMTPANACGRAAACGADWAAAYSGAARSAELYGTSCGALTDFEDHPLAVLQVGTCGMFMAAACQAALDDAQFALQ